jgi:ABC-type dipeptide/oligopeptide/nickel transport system ATPase component
MSDVVLEIKNLTRRFGAFTAVDALTLSVNAGEVFGLLGSNGAGKTTTIKMLTTLLPPSSGEARVAGFSITTQAVGVRRAIGYVPQAVSVDGSLTGYENLLIFAKLYDLPHREQQARIKEALEFMNLTADGWKSPNPRCIGRRFFFSMNRPSGWIRLRATRFGNISWICGPTTARPCSSPPITWRRRRAIVIAWRLCTWARWLRWAPAKNSRPRWAAAATR